MHGIWSDSGTPPNNLRSLTSMCLSAPRAAPGTNMGTYHGTWGRIGVQYPPPRCSLTSMCCPAGVRPEPSALGQGDCHSGSWDICELRFERPPASTGMTGGWLPINIRAREPGETEHVGWRVWKRYGNFLMSGLPDPRCGCQQAVFRAGGMEPGRGFRRSGSLTIASDIYDLRLAALTGTFTPDLAL